MGGKTQTSTSEPYGPAQPHLQRTMTDASKLYEGGVGGRTFMGSLVNPMANQTIGGLDHMQNVSQQSVPFMSSAFGRLNNLADDRNPQSVQGQDAMSAAVGGYGAPGTGQIDSIASQSQGPSFSQQNLSNVAQGKMLGGADPYFERAMEAASRKAGDAINMSASGAGRYGSGVHQGNLAREIGDMQATARSNQYNTERGRQVEANSLIDAQRGAGLDRALGAYSTSAGIQGQNADRRIGAANNLFQMGQQGFNNRMAAFDRMPAAYETAMMPGRTGLEIGGRYEDLNQRVLDDQSRIFDSTQNAPWEQLARYNAIATGMGGLGGTQTQRSNPGLGGFLGSLTSLAGLL